MHNIACSCHFCSGVASSSKDYSPVNNMNIKINNNCQYVDWDSRKALYEIKCLNLTCYMLLKQEHRIEKNKANVILKNNKGLRKRVLIRYVRDELFALEAINDKMHK